MQDRTDRNDGSLSPSSNATEEEDATPVDEVASRPPSVVPQVSDRPDVIDVREEEPFAASPPANILDSDLFVDSAAPKTNEQAVAKTSQDAKVLDDAFEVVERYEDGAVKRRWYARLYITFDRDKPLHRQAPGSWVQVGTFEEFYPGGKQRLLKGRFADGLRDGTWTYWHANGQMAKAGRYEGGALDGVWKVFREDGTLQREEAYQANQRHGTWRFYAEDGTSVMREEIYQNDVRVDDGRS